MLRHFFHLFQSESKEDFYLKDEDHTRPYVSQVSLVSKQNSCQYLVPVHSSLVNKVAVRVNLNTSDSQRISQHKSDLQRISQYR